LKIKLIIEQNGLILDIYSNEIYSATIKFKNEIIESIERSKNVENVYIMPGLIDSHIHI
jgi:adenine deaminase